jgi:spore maturation protein CgeB
LLHPEVPGGKIDDVGVGKYEAQSLVSLKEKIDYYLEHSFEREEMRETGFNWVKDHETYTNRTEEMMKVIFPEAKL